MSKIDEESKAMSTPLTPNSLELHATLPFVELPPQVVIALGPITFWPATRFRDFLKSNLHASFSDYIKNSTRFQVEKEAGELLDLGFLPLTPTCVSIDTNIPQEERDRLFIDALYLLYFSCNFRSLYYGQEVPSFATFRKIVRFSAPLLESKVQWSDFYLNASDREISTCLHMIDPDISAAFGKALYSIYLENVDETQEDVQACRRIVRSIRYLVDRFSPRFSNLFEKNVRFPKELFEPEDIVFLSSAFESLFCLDASAGAAADFKHQLRPLLHLKYSTPIEFFWKWVDDFYEVKKKMLSGDIRFNALFLFNPNFKVSHVVLGIKLFVYSIYYSLFTYKLLASTHLDPYTPPDFKWIHPEEVLLFFWTEPTVLEKIHLFIKDSETKELDDESLADLSLLTTLFVSLYDRYFTSEGREKFKDTEFLPSKVTELQPWGSEILDKIKTLEAKDPSSPLLKNIHPYFVGVLEDRLEQKRDLTQSA